MIQRKQTLFLLLAIVLSILCLSMPLGKLEPSGMGLVTTIWNLGIVTPDVGMKFDTCPLFLFLSASVVLQLVAIFCYHRRMLQIKLCTFSVVLLLLWHAVYAFFAWYMQKDTHTLHMEFATCLPLVAMIAVILARKGIMQDEKLVRSADRIR